MAVTPEMLRSAALLVIDMQNGFCHPEGGLGSAGLWVEGNMAIIPRIASLCDAAHEAGLPVLWSRQEHTDFDVERARHRVKTHLAKLQSVPCLRGTWDAEIVDELQPLIGEGDVVFPKHRSSCFYSTTLEIELRMRGIDTLIITGVSSNYCVDATIRDAYARDFDLVVAEDGCSCCWPDLHDAAMRNAALFHGDVMASEDIVEVLRAVSSDTATSDAAA